MTTNDLEHNHDYSVTNHQAERNTMRVIILTVSMAIIEISAGLIYGSMALLADGWHMTTHALALGITVFAYWFSRKHRNDPAYTFGTGKVDTLGGFTSAIVLGIVALIMAAESIMRLVNPAGIQFNQAILVAVVGLAVNLFSAIMLGSHEHEHDGQKHTDHNLKAAYLHVLADALTSLLAIGALLAGKFFGLIWLDPLMGIVGAAVILRWGYGLLRETAAILLDRDVSPETFEIILRRIKREPETKITDLHIWRLGQRDLGCIISLATPHERSADSYRHLFEDIPGLSHVTIEVNRI